MEKLTVEVQDRLYGPDAELSEAFAVELARLLVERMTSEYPAAFHPSWAVMAAALAHDLSLLESESAEPGAFVRLLDDGVWVEVSFTVADGADADRAALASVESHILHRMTPPSDA